MSELALCNAVLRALPLALCVPLPGIPLRIALGCVLALAGGSVPGLEREGSPVLELLVGAAMGVAVTMPVWVARWAGGIVGIQVGGRREPLATVYAVVAWLAFCVARGPALLIGAYLGSYSRWPLGSTLVGATTLQLTRLGSNAASLAASLALPSLLAIALVEVCAGVAQRFERSAHMSLDARSLAGAARPVIAALLLAGSLAAFTQSVAAATSLAP